MENFEHLNQELQAPEKNTSAIISHAFEIFKSNFGWGILTIILVAIVSSIINSVLSIFTAYDQIEFSNNLSEMISSGNYDVDVLVQSPGFMTSNIVSFVVSLLLYPAYVGYMYMCQKTNTGKNIDYFSDLLVGYRQNTVQIILYSLISGIIIGVSFALCFFPGLFVAPLFFIGMPIVFFENESAINALSKTFNIAKENYSTFIGTCLLSVLIGVSGIFLCGIGLVITIPFIFVASYSTYVAFCGTPRQLKEN